MERKAPLSWRISRVRKADVLHTGRPALPDPAADHLEPHRLDVRARPLHRRAVRPRHTEGAEVVHQGGHRLRAPADAERAGRLLDRLPRRVRSRQIETETGAEVVREAGAERIELRQVFLAHGENQGHFGVAGEGLFELLEEAGAVQPAVGMKGEDLLELVEDEEAGTRLSVLG
jgi:hypothetical protein